MASAESRQIKAGAIFSTVHGSQEMDEMAAADFRNAMRSFAATVSIITVNDGRRHHGMTVTSVTSLSMEPPSLLICLHQKSLVHDIMLESRHFNVNVLNIGQQGIADDFAGRLPAEERFKSSHWEFDERSVPYLVDAQSAVFCRKAAAVPFGTHTIVCGVVEKVIQTPNAGPLVYCEGAYSSSLPLSS